MANLRKMKKELREQLSRDNWQADIENIATLGPQAAGALFSFLLLDPPFMHRAAAALGATAAAIYKANPEAGRNIMRRFMWHMNEDSGNIGWGIPCAFGESLARSAGLAKEYGHILISYIIDLGFADNYCDNDQLRRDCYWAVGRLLAADSGFCPKARPWLVKGLQDRDNICRCMAVWALSQCPADLSAVPILRQMTQSGDEKCEIFENGAMREYTLGALVRKALGEA